MIDAEAIAAELEAEAQAAGFPRNHRLVNFTTAEGSPAMALVIITVADPGISEADDSFNIAFSQVSTVEVLDVLANDVDNVTGDNSTLIIGSLTQPPAGQGSVAINADGRRVDWTRPAGFFGQAQFTYTAARA